ncbi:ABC-2 type transport system permease protein [Kribbella amoyensis]|uniref:ABC-2 type transport system permease protein n=1 Tax=Kribbella amoyensis TaxID=996641 RepID=A0A561BS67_9ACTN|nr:ABC transporter permease subunit [Kribbella amoyensis]TWD81622.1 ABC-2 type transport system permease protein [Kribbella amoyensis]
MIGLAKVELRRLYARRLTLIGIAGVVVIVGLLLFATWRSARPLSDAELRTAQAQFEMAHKDWVSNAAANKAQCETDYANAPDPKPAIEEFCSFPEPKPADFGRPRFTFAETMPELLHGSSYLLAAAAFLIGASFVGAEFSSGSLGNWLTFEPRRTRVYGSKLLGMVTGMAPFLVAVLAVLIGGTVLIVETVGNGTATSADQWNDLLATAVRSAALAAVAGALGCVLGVLLRHTAAAIGVAMGYVVLVEGVFGGFLTKAQPWLLRLNIDAWVQHDTRYWVDNCQTGSDGMYTCTSIEKTLSFEHGAWYLGVLAVVLVLLGGVVFARRDVN